MYTLLNCDKLDCGLSQDAISVQIKEGANGQFREVYAIKGRTHDNKWIMDHVDFIASSDILYVYAINNN